MKFVFLFPGQGSQTTRMGFELYRDLPECRRIFDQAGPELTGQIFEGRAEDLKATETLQPAISVVNAACLEALQARGYQPHAVAGHSLGEYSAAYAAGVFGFDELLRLTRIRGRLMAAAAARNPGGMLAVNGLTESQVHEIVHEASNTEVLCIANRNSADQLVLTGHLAALERAASLAIQAGARKVTHLAVSGAWHSPLISQSRSDFEAELRSVPFNDARIDVYPNVTAEPTRSAAAIRELLARQYDSTVLWNQTVLNLIRDYPDASFVEVGPGRVLTGLLLSIDRRRTIHHVDSPASLATFIRKTA